MVARVADGDTLELESGERVRLLQVDSPELGEGECYSEQARETLERLAPPGTELDLETDPGLDSVDDFGRLLRYVFANGENVNVALVRAGAAAPYFFEGNEGSLRVRAARRGEGREERRRRHVGRLRRRVEPGAAGRPRLHADRGRRPGHSSRGTT